ncbi:hypothetical protein VDG1235_3347 [Verrucomicrobiia bacterium DG1235]|nr:hypothetical protein VDG1235_3347 [Verrucomicrobiae bacterium DG1235]
MQGAFTSILVSFDPYAEDWLGTLAKRNAGAGNVLWVL